LSDRSRAANALAIMMTDVVGSTALRRSRGDRDADEILGLQAASCVTRSERLGAT
jgi:class 3 adenylate cyclase